MAVHTTIDGGTRDELVAALAWWRGRGEDIKRVWRSSQMGRVTAGNDRTVAVRGPQDKLADSF
jgi:hypothetical protein